MTVGVYGLVAGIVKLDDAGLRLNKSGAAVQRALGRAILWISPYLMKTLSIAGTAAMFMVGGGILVHGIPGGEEFVHGLAHHVAAVPGIGGALDVLAVAVLNGLAGVIAGAVALGIVHVGQRIFRNFRPASA
jgi:predicted DNA repair protein MutK